MSGCIRIGLLFLMMGLVGNQATAAQPPDLACRVYGAVHFVSDRRLADYVVFVEESEAFADVTVALTDNRLFADRSGLWYQADHPNLADFRIFVADRRGTADFSICYTQTESFAGCR